VAARLHGIDLGALGRAPVPLLVTFVVLSFWLDTSRIRSAPPRTEWSPGGVSGAHAGITGGAELCSIRPAAHNRVTSAATSVSCRCTRGQRSINGSS
jgi:hypothetical protein